MPVTNDFKPFAAGEYVTAYELWDYLASKDRENGLREGYLQNMALTNNALRQATSMSSALAKLIEEAGVDALDDGDIDALAAGLKAGMGKLTKGVPGTYTQGVDFTDFQAFLDEHINGRVFDGTVNINLTEDVTTETYIHNVAMNANNVPNDVFLDITSAFKLGSKVRIINADAVIQLTCTAAQAVDTMFNLRNCTQVAFMGSTDCVQINAYQCPCITMGTVAGNLQVSSSFNCSIGTTLMINGSCAVNINNLRVQGRVNIDSTAQFTYTVNSLSSSYGLIIDERPGHAKDTFVRPSGTLLNPLLTMGPPDIDNIEAINRITAVNGTWTVDRDGYVIVKLRALQDTPSTLYVNGHQAIEATVAISTGGVIVGNRMLYPVKKGDVLQITGAGFDSNSGCWFVPPVLTPPVYLESQPLLDYSLVEQDTGRKWVDGKKIFQKTMPWTSTALATAASAAIGVISGVTRVVDSVVHSPDGHFGGMFIRVADAAGTITARNDSTMTLAVGNQWYFTIRYVK